MTCIVSIMDLYHNLYRIMSIWMCIITCIMSIINLYHDMDLYHDVYYDMYHDMYYEYHGFVS